LPTIGDAIWWAKCRLNFCKSYGLLRGILPTLQSGRADKTPVCFARPIIPLRWWACGGETSWQNSNHGAAFYPPYNPTVFGL